MTDTPGLQQAMNHAPSDAAAEALRGAATEVLRQHWRPTFAVGGRARCGCGAEIDVLGFPAHQAEVLVPLIAAQVRAETLREAADAWTQGAWADTPRRPERVVERIAAAQYVGDWLRRRAAAPTGEAGRG